MYFPIGKYLFLIVKKYPLVKIEKCFSKVWIKSFINIPGSQMNRKLVIDSVNPGPWKKLYSASHLLLGRSYDQPRQHIKKWRHYFANKGSSSQSYGFSSSHIWTWELDYKESWAPKNWCSWTMVLEKTLESPLDSKEIQPDNPKGNRSGIFIGRTDAEAKTLVLWLPDVKNWLIGIDPDAGEKWRREEKGTTEDEMVGGHHWLNGHEFE